MLYHFAENCAFGDFFGKAGAHGLQRMAGGIQRRALFILQRQEGRRAGHLPGDEPFQPVPGGKVVFLAQHGGLTLAG